MLFSKKYKKTIIIEGMHCGHCAKRVEEALRKINSVSSVKIDLGKKEVIVISKVDLDDDIICSTIKSLDYEVIKIN